MGKIMARLSGNYKGKQTVNTLLLLAMAILKR
jgi:hypothetical protein